MSRRPWRRVLSYINVALICSAAAACSSEPNDDAAGGFGGGVSADGGGGNSSAEGGGVGVGGTGGGDVGGFGGAAEPDGSWRNPFPIVLPAALEGDTTEAVSDAASSYFPCAPLTNEGGPEVVYQFTVQVPGWLSARLDDIPGDSVDVDLQLLSAKSADACVTRHDSWLGSPVVPGDYWLVVDSWVNGDNNALAGAYTLDVELVEDGNLACLESPIACDGMLPPFVNIEITEQQGDAGCMTDMARVDDFCIDRYEAMVVEDDGNGGLLPVSPYVHPSPNAVLMAVSMQGAIPQGHISQIQAADACLMAGKRLCTDSEWLRACQGATPTTYPYGNTLEPGRCNDDRICHPVPQYFESVDNWIWSELAHPCISQLPEGLAATGSHTDCATTENAFDMMGNLHEWTSDPAGTFRGGFYVDTVVNGPGCLYATTAHDISHHDYSTGFRCCTESTQ